ncbi:MAG: type II toxin-antitoxin system RelE/ParE family toxin [bacterium]|nr:type II toxin-antitoxin system RelE/ParE family toxin [bacterium]
MAYSVALKRSAEKELDILPDKIHDHIVSQLLAFKENPRPTGVIKLRGRPGYRKRVGDYRILYIIDDENKRVEVVSIAHRKEVYR